MTYIRFFAETAGGRASATALEYLRSIIRIAPVRLVSVTGPLDTPWRVFERALSTPMTGEFVANIVCASPEHWCRRLRIPMPEKDPMGPALASGTIGALAKDTKVAEAVVELYTAGVRNVLIAQQVPRSADQVETAAKYEMVITDTKVTQTQWWMTAGTPVLPAVIPTPVTDHAALRELVVGQLKR